MAVRNRATRRRLGGNTFGKGTPIDLGVKEYKRKHRNEPKRVLYFKQEMWKAYRELKEER